VTVVLLRASPVAQRLRELGEQSFRAVGAEAGNESAIRTGRRRRYGPLVVSAVVLAAISVSSNSPRPEPGPALLHPTAPAGSALRRPVGTIAALALHAVDAPSLLSLADANRLSGDLDQAKRAYVALRSRFQTSVEAGAATFWLGEMEFSNQKDYADAGLWFGTYLREQPRGAFSIQAQERLMEALYRIGDWGGALRIANEYVAAHPNAPDSKVALAILHDEDLPE
jgi:TolA-binding protein